MICFYSDREEFSIVSGLFCSRKCVAQDAQEEFRVRARAWDRWRCAGLVAREQKQKCSRAGAWRWRCTRRQVLLDRLDARSRTSDARTQRARRRTRPLRETRRSVCLRCQMKLHSNSYIKSIFRWKSNRPKNRLLLKLMCRRHSKDVLTGAENGLV